MALETELDEEKKVAQVVEYLQGPRKKRKSYIISAFGSSFDSEVSSAIQSWVKKNYSNVATASPKHVRELSRLFSRQILLLMVDDQYCDLEELMEEIKQLKSKKHNAGTPVLFFTEDIKTLIETYHKILLPHQEADNYVSYRSLPMNQIYSRIQAAMNVRAARRSKRFNIDIPVRFFHLSKNQFIEGHLVEMSVHGGELECGEDLIFKKHDQMKIHLPVKGYLPPEMGEFFRVPARVRRVKMGGNIAALSWEHLSEVQHNQLTSFVLEYMNSQMVRMPG